MKRKPVQKSGVLKLGGTLKKMAIIAKIKTDREEMIIKNQNVKVTTSSASFSFPAPMSTGTSRFIAFGTPQNTTLLYASMG